MVTSGDGWTGEGWTSLDESQLNKLKQENQKLREEISHLQTLASSGKHTSKLGCVMQKVPNGCTHPIGMTPTF